MNSLVILSCLVVFAWGAPVDRSRTLRFLPALRHEEVHDEFGQYALRYITAENTVVSERGHLVPTAEGGHVLEIEGQYRYIGDDGREYVTTYHGGPDGFHVEGAHLPKPVLMPTI